MKKILLSVGVLSLTLFSHPGSTADLALSSARAPTHLSVSMTEIRVGAAAPPMKLAAIGDPGSGAGAGNLRGADANSEKPAAEALPSTPVALGGLLLILCILIRRRNTPEQV